MIARETNNPSPVDDAPGWNGWNSRSAEEIPGPLSEMRITTEESSEYAATRIRPLGTSCKARRLFFVRFRKTCSRPERLTRIGGRASSTSHSDLTPAKSSDGEM